jgi:Macrocin-O-methyltransferase (TylF)
MIRQACPFKPPVASKSNPSRIDSPWGKEKYLFHPSKLRIQRMTINEAIFASKIDPKKNSEQNIDYYESLSSLYESDPKSTLLKLRSFAVYAPRQVVTDFLVRYELFKMILDIPGSILEFGVFNGQGLFSFAHFSTIMEPSHITRRIVGFDTFGGFSGVGKEDASSRSQFMRDGDYAVDSYDSLSKAIDLFDQNRFIGHVPKVELVKGDVTLSLDEYLDQNPHTIAAMLYLDMDIYTPTKHVLERMIRRVPKGGIVAFDELNMKDFPGETIALLESLNLNSVPLRRFPFCSRIAYFIV